MNRPIITSIPPLTAVVGQPYIYQVTAIAGSSDPMEQLRLSLAALDDALAAYDNSMQQAQAAVNSQLVSVRDAINAVLGDSSSG
jgi:hypothetical protein